MAKLMLRPTDKKCALCRNWNGAVGSTTITPKLGGNFQIEATEKQICYVRTGQTTANFGCAKFVPRYGSARKKRKEFETQWGKALYSGSRNLLRV